MPVMELERQTDSNPAGVHRLLERRYTPMLFLRAPSNRKNSVNCSRPPARRLRLQRTPWRFIMAAGELGGFWTAARHARR